MDTKECKDCHAVKPKSEFYGVQGECKECTKARVRKHREENIEEIRAYDRLRGRTEERKAKVRAARPKYADRQYNKKHRERNPEKYKARTAVGNAIRDGRLTKGVCEVCGTDKVHAHHDDYSKPLEVRWLCVDHHMEEHRVYV